MPTRVMLALTVLVYLLAGQAPRSREVRNPDAEFAHGRTASTVKRSMG